jgi:hypothetical protein
MMKRALKGKAVGLIARGAPGGSFSYGHDASGRVLCEKCWNGHHSHCLKDPCECLHRTRATAKPEQTEAPKQLAIDELGGGSIDV